MRYSHARSAHAIGWREWRGLYYMPVWITNYMTRRAYQSRRVLYLRAIIGRDVGDNLDLEDMKKREEAILYIRAAQRDYSRYVL